MIGSTTYIPRRGDVVWINLDPQRGQNSYVESQKGV